MVSIGFGTLCFIDLLCVMLVYDQKAMPSFPQGLTLNIIISILATDCKFSLLCMVGNATGQLKWIWFKEGKKRQLYNMQYSSNASCGLVEALGELVE